MEFLVEHNGKLISRYERNRLIWLARRTEKPTPTNDKLARRYGLSTGSISGIIKAFNIDYCIKHNLSFKVGPTRWSTHEQAVDEHYSKTYAEKGIPWQHQS